MKIFILIMFFPVILFSNPIHTELGTPTSSENINIVERFEFTSGFRCDYGVPLWVSYNLNRDWFGDTPRFSGNFKVDSLLPQDCWVKHSDYTNSGYDRGHLVRSEERTRSVDENIASFRTTNIIPQLPELNQQTWLKMEYYAEKLAKDSLKEMYIYAGPIYTKDKLVTMYKDKVAIPDSCYKIIVVMDYGSKLADVNENTEVIACIFPNNDENVKNFDWTTFKTSVNHIENSTGLDFFTSLPSVLQDRLEGRTTSVTEKTTSKQLIYPNPATDFVTIPADNYSVYNSLGSLMGTYNSPHLQTTNFPNGVYFVRVGDRILNFVK